MIKSSGVTWVEAAAGVIEEWLKPKEKTVAGLERDDEAYFNRRVKETGGETRKVKWLGRRGAPDRLAGWKKTKRFAIVELKHPDQSWGLQDHQEREIARLRSWGIDVRVIAGRDQIDQFVEEMSK